MYHMKKNSTMLNVLFSQFYSFVHSLLNKQKKNRQRANKPDWPFSVLYRSWVMLPSDYFYYPQAQQASQNFILYWSS